MHSRTILFFLAVFSLFACNKEINVPSYIYVYPFTFAASAAEGGGSFDITNGIILVDNVVVGNFEFPVAIPVDNEGAKSIEIFPSIKENGVSNGRRVYNLYKTYLSTTNLERGKTDTIRPSTSYKTNTYFEWLEDFDNQSISLTKGNNNTIIDSLTVYPFTHPDAYKGSNEGYSAGINFRVGSNGNVWEALSTVDFEVPKLGTDIYLEMDVLSDVDIKVGILYYDGATFRQVEVVQFFNTEGKWKKLYANLVTEIGPLSSATKVRIFIGGLNSTDGTGTPKVFIDNIKLAYLK